MKVWEIATLPVKWTGSMTEPGFLIFRINTIIYAIILICKVGLLNSVRCAKAKAFIKQISEHFFNMLQQSQFIAKLIIVTMKKEILI